MKFAAVIAGCWVVFILYWLASLLSTKRTLGGVVWWKQLAGRLLIIIVILFLVRSRKFRDISTQSFLSATAGTKSLGVLLCMAGIGLAIWSRWHLGTNWGMPMSLKEEPELVTTGPYRVIRHPIYSGVLLALLGSSFVLGLPMFVAFVLFAIYFIYSARVEERNMKQSFPERYPAYKKRTKRLIPLIY